MVSKVVQGWVGGGGAGRGEGIYDMGIWVKLFLLVSDFVSNFHYVASLPASPHLIVRPCVCVGWKFKCM